jgi:hypothetical protein
LRERGGRNGKGGEYPDKLENVNFFFFVDKRKCEWLKI